MISRLQTYAFFVKRQSEGQWTIVSIDSCQWKKRRALLTDCQTKRARRGFVASKYELVGRKGLLGRFAIDGTFVRFLSFCLTFVPVCTLSSVFSLGRTQFHTFGIIPLCALKNENRWLFSYGRTTTTVRTRPYDGSRSSVRSQPQVLSTVKMGSADAFSAL